MKEGPFERAAPLSWPVLPGNDEPRARKSPPRGIHRGGLLSLVYERTFPPRNAYEGSASHRVARFESPIHTIRTRQVNQSEGEIRRFLD
jgi:hypothetical protein